jgi:hypothetical protein
MNQINLIRKTLRTHLSQHGARVTFLALFLVALVRVRTVNFVELAQGFMGNAQTESSEKRLHRFFSEFDLDYHEVARLVAGLMEIPQPRVLSIDRPNWQFGDCVFNILMLRVVHEGVVFPLVWTMLNKKGNSNYKERIVIVFLMARIPSTPKWSLVISELENNKCSSTDGGCGVTGYT